MFRSGPAGPPRGFGHRGKGGDGHLVREGGHRVRARRPVGAEDEAWGGFPARIELDPGRFGLAALQGVEEFSHLEVLFVFDRVAPGEVETGVRRPRGRADWPRIGIYTQRATNRPNRIGLSTCEFVRGDGLAIEVRGLDAIDGTPVLDIKPVMAEFLARGDVRQPRWAVDLMSGYW